MQITTFNPAIVTKAAEEPFREYLKRNPPKKKNDGEARSVQDEDPYL